MSTYGQFESEDRFCDSGQIVLFNARSKDALDSRKYIIRVFKNTTDDSDQLNYFLANSRAQASLTQENGAKHWAPVIEVGSRGSQGYCVQPKYELNLEDFISHSRFSLTDAILRHFVQGIVAGLREAEKLGTHGNLKPANILLEVPGKWSEAIVRLNDARFHQSTNSPPESDFKALARIIYYLVMGREPAPTLQRVSPEENWSFQDGDASYWKDFCNQLLADTGTLTLTDVQRLLDQVPIVSKQADLTKIVSIVLLVCCLLVVGFFLIRQCGKEKNIPEPSVAQWEMLVDDYNTWVRTVELSIKDAKKGDEEAQFWMNDEYLKETVLQWYQKELDDGVLVDPWLVIDKKVDYRRLLPPPRVLGERQYLKRLEKSHFFVEELRRKINEWPAFARLETISEEFKKLGLEGPADEIMQVVEQFDRNFDEDLIRQLKLIYNTEQNATLLRDDCKQLLKISEALSKQGRPRDGLPEDKVLKKLHDYVRDSWSTVSSLELLQDTIKPMSQKIESIGKIVYSKAYREEIDLKRFREQSEVNQTDKAISEKVIDAWLDEILQYKRS